MKISKIINTKKTNKKTAVTVILTLTGSWLIIVIILMYYPDIIYLVNFLFSKQPIEGSLLTPECC